MPTNTPVEIATSALQSYLKTNLSEIQQILMDFPTPNQVLKMPSITLATDTTNAYNSVAPYEIAVSAPNSEKKVQITWCVGMYDFKIQMDLWARSRIERNAIFSHFYEVFNKRINPMGLSLQLNDYYGIYARYDLIGYSHADDEQSSQRGEWRTRIDLVSNIPSILTQTDFAIIESIVSQTEITDNLQ